MGIGSVFLLLVTVLKKESLLKWRFAFKHFLVITFLLTILPIYLTNYSETKITSSLAGILNATQPIFACILAHYLLETEKFSVKSLTGICIGFAGILIVFLPSGVEAHHERVLGIITMLIAALTSSFSAVYIKKFLYQIPGLVCATYQFILGTLITAPIALLVSRDHLFQFPSIKVLASISVLGVFGSAVAFILFYYLIKHAGATYVTTVTLLLPFVAIFLGVVILQEQVSWNAYVGCVLILTGLTITHSLINLQKIKQLFSSRRKPE